MTAIAKALTVSGAWPALPLSEWDDTRATLQLWMQIVGKTRLWLSPMQNHWWHVTFYLTARGLTTSPMPSGARTLEIEFDFFDHVLIASTSDGRREQLKLVPKSVADFYHEYRQLLRSLEFDVKIWPRPVEVTSDLPFTQDRVHASYDGDAAHRFWRILSGADRVLKQFRGEFLGKCSPVHFWWGGSDLACTRFSGRPAPPHPGGIPNMADWVTREAYSHECISVGWWPGGVGMPVSDAAFYAYAYPEPPGCPDAKIRPEAASYHTVMREWILPYEAVRQAQDGDAMVLEFAHSTYEAAATLAHWDRAALERRPP